MGTDIKEYMWFIAILADWSYRFIPPTMLIEAERYIGKHGGGIYTPAGHLVFAANRSWWSWLTSGKETGFIDVPNIECTFSQGALQWLKDNEDMLREKGGKYYEYIPRH